MAEQVEDPAADQPLLQPPDDWPRLSAYERVMTNLDHSIDKAIADRLRQGGLCAQHSALEFCGVVWFADGCWHETVLVHHHARGSYSADTLEALMKVVNDEFGWR